MKLSYNQAMLGRALAIGTLLLLSFSCAAKVQTWSDCELVLGTEARNYRCTGASVRFSGGSPSHGESRDLKALGGQGQFLRLEFKMPKANEGPGVPYEIIGGRLVAPGEPPYEMEILSGSIVMESASVTRDNTDLGDEQWVELLSGHFEAKARLAHPVVNPTGPRLREHSQVLRSAVAELRGTFLAEASRRAKHPQISKTPEPRFFKERAFP